MAHRFSFLSLLAITLLLLTCVGMPATSHGQTVVDFFHLLPDQALKPWNEIHGELTPARRKALLSGDATAVTKAKEETHVREIHVDTKNGYLDFTSPGDGEGMNVHMTYWREKKQKDGACLIAVVIDGWSVASHSTDLIKFYRWAPEAPKKLEDVSAQHIPALHAENFFKTTKEIGEEAEAAGLKWWWILPQKGTSIRIQGAEIGEDQLADKLGPPQYVYVLDWNGTDFSMKREAVKE
ncbi:hypothetical protein [Verrucomicrobium sp. BvORR034]|uniref:hypothetical protein n=1 Tax=Verrucomicrobium sp. BvORR034 TaxID=1396418 RepID=UPI000678EB6F|nr:hypothetical protein [Verrucomicrobium sp. BvORR034]